MFSLSFLSFMTLRALPACNCFCSGALSGGGGPGLLAASRRCCELLCHGRGEPRSRGDPQHNPNRPVSQFTMWTKLQCHCARTGWWVWQPPQQSRLLQLWYVVCILHPMNVILTWCVRFTRVSSYPSSLSRPLYPQGSGHLCAVRV